MRFRPADQRHKVVAQLVDFVSNGIEKFGAAFRAELAEFDKGLIGGIGGAVYFLGRGLMKAKGQGNAGTGIEAFKGDCAGSATAAADKVLACYGRHRFNPR